MVYNRGYNSWYAVRRRGLSKAERDKEDEEALDEVEKELRDFGIAPRHHRNVSKGQTVDEPHTPSNELSCFDSESSSSSQGDSSLHSDDKPSMPHNVNESAPHDLEEAPPSDDENHLPPKADNIDGGEFVKNTKIPFVPVDENASPTPDDENPLPVVVGRLENGVYIPISKK